MDLDSQRAEAQNFGRIVSVLKRHGLREAPSFNRALRVIEEQNEAELTRLVSEYPNRDEFESLLFLYWDS